ncbi:MAG: serine/threonine protein kinase, partial [Gemmatimonadetes bacterium]|nr:serine/threonine protein kinase [Gemmatimonadota bacterium]
MSPADWRRLEELLHAASQRPPHERAAFLAEVTAGDTTLAAEIMSLLYELDADPAFLQTPVLHIRGSPADDAEERLGPYRIVRPLGGGGMGDVYLAVRDDPYQLVAVKRVRGELGGPEADRRFRNEGRILAALSHPNIARLLDVGTDRAGRPYVVMEYVPGVPVDQHADAERLDIPARIRLFQTLCSAVQHAHQSLIVHRDIKPANVLVTEDGTPKLLDFGIGKILDADAGTVGLTRTEHRALTPEYASPEQIRGEAITTATDIYSLGVLLHELLGGRRPFGDGGLSGRALEDRILEREPPPPSAALLRDPDAQVRARGRALTGDLDTIVLKAMRKEPYRRYTSAAALAEDLQRHLDGLPVLARPTTLGYRTGKFVRRHRLPVGIGSLLAVTLLASTTVARAQAHRIQEESQRVAHERDKAFQVRTFLLETFGATGPDLPLGGNATARALLDARARTLEEVGDPELRGEFLDVLAEGYEKLGLFEEAERHARAGLRLRTDLFGPQHGDVATSLNTLGWILHQRGRLEEADSLLRTAVALRRTLHPEGHEQLARSLNDLGVVREAARDYEEAERLYRESMEMRRAALGEDDRGVAVTESNLAVVQYRLGRLPEAIGTATRAVETFRRVSGP